MLMTVASKLISAAGKHDSQLWRAEKDHTQGICDKPYFDHAWSEQLPHVVEGIMCF